ncbi:MAG: preprotein translocase subunit YajC [Planctomycetes bacterium GWC2_45_44]|nr:MAG: preprotein translocase subunit YajC [Planctomycetes bacterium GWC2_45_44]
MKNPKAQWQQFIFIGLIFVVMYFIMFRGPRKKQQQQKQMIMALKKNDRVQTIGGILGTVLEVSETEVVLKIDEANNTKLRVLPSAVSRVIEQK